MNNLFLCFFGDSRLWDNIVLSTAYPTEYSYFRPFRYRDNWMQSGLLREIENKEKREVLLVKPTILGIRFVSEQYRWMVLPIRQVQLTHIDYMPDNHAVFFKMGDMVDFRHINDLRSICFEIPIEERETIKDSALFFQSDAGSPTNLNYIKGDVEDAAWVAYCNLIANDTTLPIHEEARKSLFLRFLKPANSHAAETTKIYQSNRMGKIYGSQLSEGSNYELVLLHRAPVLIGTHTTIGRVAVNYNVPTGNIELSRSEEDFTGNYQTHIVSITAKKPTGTWEELIVGPIAEKVTADDGRTINTLKLKIPVKVKLSPWYRFRTIGIWILLLWLALTATAVVDGISEGKLSISILVVQAIISAIASILIVFVGRKV